MIWRSRKKRQVSRGRRLNQWPAVILAVALITPVPVNDLIPKTKYQTRREDRSFDYMIVSMLDKNRLVKNVLQGPKTGGEVMLRCFPVADALRRRSRKTESSSSATTNSPRPQSRHGEASSSDGTNELLTGGGVSSSSVPGPKPFWSVHSACTPVEIVNPLNGPKEAIQIADAGVALQSDLRRALTC